MLPIHDKSKVIRASTSAVYLSIYVDSVSLTVNLSDTFCFAAVSIQHILDQNLVQKIPVLKEVNIWQFDPKQMVNLKQV